MSSDDVLSPLTRLRPGKLVDELSTDDGTVVMVVRGTGGVVVRLSPLGREILDAVAATPTLDELVSEMLSRLGEPTVGDVASLVRDAVETLLETAVVVVDEA